MPVRLGEMVLVVRTQDFASRNLARISSNIGKLSRVENLSRQRDMLRLRQAEVSERVAGQQAELRNLRTIKQRLLVEQQLNRTMQQRDRLQKREAQILARQPRGPGGQFAAFPPAQLAALRDVQNRISQLNAAEQAFTRQHNRLADLINRMPSSVRRYAYSLADATQRIRGLEGSVRRGSEQLRLFDDDLRRIAHAESLLNAQRVHGYGQVLSRVGRQAQLFGLITTAGLGMAAQSAADFSSASTLAATQAGFSLEQIRLQSADLQKGILQLSQQFPATADEMAKSAYQIFSSMDVAFGEGMQLLERFNQVAVAGGTDLATATNAGITVLNNFRGASDDLNETLNQMFAIVRFGRLNFQEFDQVLTKVAPAAAQANQSLEDMGAAIAVLTRHAPSPRQAGTQLARLTDALLNPDLQKGLQQAGANITDASGNLRPLIDVFEEIDRALPNLRGRDLNQFFQLFTASGRGGGRGVFGYIEARRAFTTLMKNLDEYRALQQNVTMDADEFVRALEAMEETPGVQWQVFKNQMRAFAITLGMEVIPVFADIGDKVQGMVEAFQGLPAPVQAAIGQMAGWGGIGLLIGGVFASILGSMVELSATLATLSPKVLGFKNQLGALGAIGAIAIALKVAWTGEASAMDFIMGAMAGAAAGAPFGPAGIVVGAITVPVILSLVDRFTGGKDIPGFVQDAIEAQQNAYAPIPTDQIIQAWERAGDRVVESANGRLLDIHEIFYEELGRIRKRMQELKKLETIPRPDESRSAATKAKVAADERKVIQKRKQQNNEYLKALREWYQKQLDYQAEYSARQKRMNDDIARAREQANDQITQAAQNLTNRLMGLIAENKRIFGELFQGPWLTSETMDLAKEWGVVPSIQDMNRDLSEQIQRFNLFNTTLNRIAKRGGPAALIEELRGLGPEALPMIENLANAANPEFNKFVGLWNTKQQAIEKISRDQLNKQLKMWRSYGKNIFQQIIFGLQEGDHVGLNQAFRKYVIGQFPNFVQEAVDKAIADFKANNPPGGSAPQKPKPPTQVVRGPQGVTGSHEENYYYFYLPPGTSPEEAARFAAWYFKQTGKKAKRIPPGRKHQRPETIRGGD